MPFLKKVDVVRTFFNEEAIKSSVMKLTPNDIPIKA
jgi:hypothetical protein